MASREEDVLASHQEIRCNVIDADIKELEFAVVDCNIPSKEELMAATINEPLEWDAIESYSKFANQSEESFKEQKLAITTCIDAMDDYRDSLCQGTCTKNVGIRGLPGGEKT